MHNAMVNLGGVKISKSAKNSVLVTEVVKRVRPIELRYYLLAAHYRSIIEFGFESLAESAAAFKRIEGYVVRATETSGGAEPGAEVPEEFARAMDDDLGVPAALAVLQGVLREGNKNLGDVGTLASVRAMLGVLGLDPLAAPWSAGSDDAALTAALDALVGSLVAARQEARAAKDFAAADAIRDQLTAAGIEVEDTAGGPRWTVSGT
jgi:cysteinyl-tRNA synthetase